MRRAFFALPLVLAATTVACSPETADLFLSGGTGGAGGASGSTSSVSKSVTSTSTSPPDTTATTTTVSTSGNPDTVASSTSGTPDTVSVVASSSSGNPGGPVVACGMAGSCDVGNDEVCCWDSQGKTGDCTSPDGCNVGVLPTSISCQRPSDCEGGDICCAHRYFNSDQQPYETTQCDAECDLPDRHVCDPMAPSNVCPFYNDNGQTKQMICKTSTLLPAGYFVCGVP